VGRGKGGGKKKKRGSLWGEGAGNILKNDEGKWGKGRSTPNFGNESKRTTPWSRRTATEKRGRWEWRQEGALEGPTSFMTLEKRKG